MTPTLYILGALVGVVAQLVERLNGIQEVRGSNPLGSTIIFYREENKIDAWIRPLPSPSTGKPEPSQPMPTVHCWMCCGKTCKLPAPNTDAARANAGPARCCLTEGAWPRAPRP